jgi:hypothetical protein
VNRIGTCLFGEFRCELSIFEADTVVFAELGSVDAAPDREGSSSGRLAGGDGLAEQPSAIFSSAAVSILAKIPRRRKEFREDVAVGAMNFYGIESRPLGAVGGSGEIFNEFGEVLFGGLSNGRPSVSRGSGH